MDTAFLILADGTVFEGHSIGAKGKTIGETVFTTGMTGYLETLTDPSYYGQIVTQTFPLIGNYGVIDQDFESRKCWVKGYIVREMCDKPSNFRCGGNLDEYLKKQGIVGICGIDTRALTKKLRDAGVMNGMIVSGEEFCSDIDPETIKKIKAYKIEQAVESVQGSSVLDAQSGMADATSCERRVALFDFGAKANIQRELEKRGCKVTVVPCDTKAEKILEMQVDGVMLSNGPGDPAENTSIINEINKLCEWNKTNGGQLPIFGICLGHQMLSLARGAKTTKLKYGHRGGNHPVKDVESGRVYITSQNHGYAVETDSLPDFARQTFYNVNDGTCEGVEYKDIPAFSVQFHPEACGGPHDTNFLFDRFVKMMEKENASK
ncbi:MAG: carbamoyl phosphate synthase small subunit [Treponemataceae bacterium]|nr:carbamoyl phosphate synthase small subunit [Treponemataceae bacterium]